MQAQAQAAHQAQEPHPKAPHLEGKTPPGCQEGSDRDGRGEAGSTHSLRLLQHGQDEEHVSLARLQGPVLEVVIVFHVPQDEVRGQRAEAGGDVGPGEVQLPRVPQAPAPQPGNVLHQLQEAQEHPESLQRSSKESQTSPPTPAAPWLP